MYRGASVLHEADRQTEAPVDRAHPLGIAPREVVVEREHVHAMSRERLERRRQTAASVLPSPVCISTTWPLVEREAGHHLLVERTFVDRAPRRLASQGEQRHREHLAWFSGAGARAQRDGLLAKSGVGERAARRLEIADGPQRLLIRANVVDDARTSHAPEPPRPAGTVGEQVSGRGFHGSSNRANPTAAPARAPDPPCCVPTRSVRGTRSGESGCACCGRAGRRPRGGTSRRHGQAERVTGGARDGRSERHPGG